jgi:hypothetical protein
MDTPTPGATQSTIYLLAPVWDTQNPLGFGPIEHPEEYEFGLCATCDNAQFRGAQLIYSDTLDSMGAPIHQFVPDLSSSPVPSGFEFPKTMGNDPVVPTPGCSAPSDFMTGPDGELYYLCGGTDGAWWSGSVEMYHGDAKFMCVGAGGLILAWQDSSFGVLDLSAHKFTAAPGVPAHQDYAIRWKAGSFHIVLNDEQGGALLYEIRPDGSSTQLGAYQEAAPDGVLTEDDHFVVVGYADAAQQTVAIKRLGLDGSSEQVFSSDLPHPIFQLQAATLITGR